MKPDIDQVERRVKGYWFQDGFGEMAGGLVFLVLGSYFALSEYLGDSFWGGLLQAAFILVFFALMFVGRRLVAALKSRFVYPRTGFVEYRVDEDTRHRRKILAGLVGALMAAMFTLVLKATDIEDLTPALTGLVGGAILVFAGTKSSGVARFFVLALISIALGVALSFIPLAMGYALGMYYGLMALAFFISGAVVLSRYLRKSPRPRNS